MSAGGLVTVRTVGGLVPADLLGRIVAGHDLDGLDADDFHLELGVTPKEAANRAWAVLRQAWVNYRAAMAKLPEGDRATGLTREKWLSVLLRELGFGRIPTTPAGGILVDDRSYPVSHEVDQIPIHLLGWGVDLDRRSPGLAGAAARAPHAMVQELLNRSDDHLWAILANGGRLRLLRDSANLVGQAFVEFDLETMFDVEVFSDFVALFLLAHQTRFEPVDPEAGIEDCWLERWRSDAVETGARALGQLRDGVKAAIESLGTGFLRHPDNAELRSRLEPDGDLDLATFHRALLRLVYRLLFCFVSEDRGLLLDPAASEETRVRYTTWFSTARLRTIATRRRGTRHDDLWIALRLVLDGLGADEGRPELALPGLGGLFGVTDADPVAGCALGNDALLAAVRHLCVIQPKEGGPRRNIDYQHLGTEELGSIYESLLEFVPRHDSATRTFNLAALSGNDRKTTGAHYTPAPLIDCLLEASLDHLLDEAETGDDPEAVLLAITVCDPAAGSGHFLVAAARRIAHRLARVRSGDDEPSVPTTQSALRDVIAHCVYGIDINPMAVELCKVSLWLEAMEAGKPLSFLDHHVVCGNGLIGATPRLIAGGVPDAAFKAIEGDEKKIVTKRRATNKRERKARGQGLFAFNYGPEVLAEDMARIEQLPDDSAAQVAAKAERFRAMQVDQSTVRARLEADAWCAAFVAEKNVGHPAITDSTVRVAGTNPDGLDPDARDEIEVLRERYRFLHWHLAFPQIYRVDLDDGGEHGWTGGFDLVIGNPPWDTLSPDAKEFFSTYEPEIRFQKGREQEATIARLETIPGIAEAWSAHRRELFALVHFIKASGRYRMFAPGNLGKGDFDMYRMFVETALATSAESGWAAQVVKSGLYNGSNAAGLRKELFESCQLGLLAGLINRAHHWFSAVHADLGIAVYAARRGGSTQEFRAGFGITDEAGLERLLTDPVWISTKTVRAQSPAALAVSEVKPGPDATIMAKLYEAWPPFGEVVADSPHRFYQREIDMGNDRGLFGDFAEGLPLYEGRMIDQYDHRAKAYRSGRGRAAVWEPLKFGSPEKMIVPQWRVPVSAVPDKVGERVNRYRAAFGDVTGPRNERSLLAALIPHEVISGHSAPTVTFGDDRWDWLVLIFLAIANSFVADFVIRKRVTLHVTFSILDELPMPRWTPEEPLVSRLAPLVLRLTCTGPEMVDYWNVMSEYGWCEQVPAGTVPPSALVDPDERAEAKAEIDAIVAKRVYGLTRDEFAYVLDQFPVLERRDREAYGTFATKDRALGWYDRV